MFDLIIRNGIVVDGTGAERRVADVAVKYGFEKEGLYRAEATVNGKKTVTLESREPSFDLQQDGLGQAQTKLEIRTSRGGKSSPALTVLIHGGKIAGIAHED